MFGRQRQDALLTRGPRAGQGVESQGNRTMTKTTNLTYSPVPDRDGLEARFGVRVASMLGERAQSTAPDISERLRFAREQALVRAQAARRQERLAGAPVVVGRGRTAVLANPLGWWFKLGSAA